MVEEDGGEECGLASTISVAAAVVRGASVDKEVSKRVEKERELSEGVAEVKDVALEFKEVIDECEDPKHTE